MPGIENRPILKLTSGMLLLLTLSLTACTAFAPSQRSSWKLTDPPSLAPQNQPLNSPKPGSPNPQSRETQRVGPQESIPQKETEPAQPDKELFAVPESIDRNQPPQPRDLPEDIPSRPRLETPQPQTRAKPETESQRPSGPMMTPPAQTGPLEMTVDVIPKRQLGSGATFYLIIKNTSNQSVRNVLLECEFDSALLFPGRREKKIGQRLGTLQPGESKEINLTLYSDTLGNHCCRFRAMADGEELVWKSVCVEYVKKQLELSVIGPSARTIGSRAEYIIKLSNVNDVDLKNVQVAVAYDASLIPREASIGSERETGKLKWMLDTIRVGEGVQLQVEFDCEVAAEYACMRVNVTSPELPDEQASACLKVTPAQGVLDVQVRDTKDPIARGEETTYEVSIENRGLQPARGIQLRAKIPRMFRVVSVEAHQGNQKLNLRPEVNQNTLTVSPIQELPADAFLRYTIQVKALSSGDGEFDVTITSDDSDKLETRVSEITTVNR
ncbi:Large cysteine-rich periplasmic protein OmcB precursor [Gimesia panareensis]|nr:Large cysteine-rich periplasmic protein OmcB precursor [Gimesia panareensis]